MSDEGPPKIEVVSGGRSKTGGMTPVYLIVTAIVFLAIGFFASGAMGNSNGVSGSLIASASPGEANASTGEALYRLKALTLGQWHEAAGQTQKT